MPVKIRLDHAGIRAVLNSGEVADVVEATAEAIAATVRSEVDAENGTVVDTYRTDRAAASVTIRDVSGKLWQVRDGVLTRAAAAQRLEVNAR